ncbi:MAG: response regulator [Bacteroidales bacterium]|nr:response regulator [Bacteroidales bacterium]
MQIEKILLIDDELSILKSIIHILEKDSPDYVFFQATDGTAGFKIAERYLPDIIIIDWEMPGIDGIDTIKCLKNSVITHHIPVIMLTGKMTSSENLKVALDAGAIDFIRKPIDEIELVARTKSMLMLASYYNNTIKLKNQELTSTAINLVQKNEERIQFIKRIKKIDEEFGEENQELSDKLKKIYQQISHNMGNDAWEQFENYFRKTHPGFFGNLLLKFKKLSSSDLKIAVLTRMQLSSKDMASIMFISEHSVKTARSRLRKKLNIKRTENLTMFLQKF